MFKKLKNKIQVELDKEHQSSTNVSMCSSMSSSRADLTQGEDQKNQVPDSLAALYSNDIEEEDDSEEILQKFPQRKDIKQSDSATNLTGLADDNQKAYFKEHEKVLDDLLIKVESSFNSQQSMNNLQATNINSINKKAIENNHLEENGENSEQIDKIKRKIAELDELKDKFIKVEEALREQMNKNQKLENLNLNLQNSKHEINLQNNKLINKLDDMRKQSKLAQDKLNKLKDDNRLLSEKNDEFRKMIEGLRESLEFEKEEKLELKNELFKLKMNAQTKPESNKNEKLIDELKEKVGKLEDQIAEKNKTIKLQNQRIHDIKKSVQKGDLFLKDETNGSKQQQSNGNLGNGYSSRNDSSTRLDEQIVNGKSQNELVGKLNNNKDYATYVNDINFRYLQNVVLKFITSTDHESQKHLVKAISTLLKFSPEEEQIIKQSLESRGSNWFKLTENLKF